MTDPVPDTWAAILQTLADAGMSRAAVARKLGIHIEQLDTLSQFRLPRVTHAGMTGLGERARAIGTTVDALRTVLDQARGLK